MEKMTDLIFFFPKLIKLKIQEQTKKRLFGSFCIIVNYHNETKDTHSVSENSLKFAFGKNARCAVTVRSIDRSWLLSMDDMLFFCTVNTSVFSVCAYPKQVPFFPILKGNRYFPEESIAFVLPPNYSFTTE